jgi:hypothetical protein
MEITLFREPAVQVEVRGVTGLVAVEAPAIDPSRGSFGRLVKAFRVEPAGQVRATVVISPNRPKIQAEQITRLANEADAWQAEVDFRFKVTGGVADQFSFDVPPQWNGPYKVDPPAAIKVVDSPEKARRQLIVRPRSAVEGEYRMSISGPLALGANERPSALKVVAEDVAVSRHRLILPAAPQGTAGAWETRGLVPTSVPEELPIAAAERGSYVAYQVARQSYQAVLRLPEHAERTPHVPFAEVRFAWQPDGDCGGVASFDLEPAGLDSCPLALPPEFRLMQVLVDGLPTLPVPAGANQWRLLLGSTRLTQHVEVLFRGQLPGTADAPRRGFPVPTLGAIPVRQAVWSVAGPAGYQWSPGEQQEPLSGLQHALVQVRNLAAIVERAAEFPGEDPEDLARWYRRWARRWAGARLEMSRQLALAGPASEVSAIREEVETLDKRQAAAGGRLGLSEVFSQAAAEPLVRQSPADLWELETPATVRFRAAVGPEPVTLAYRRASHWPLAPRGLLALLIGGLTIGAIWSLRRGIVPKHSAGWGYGVGLVVGVVWWWWLSPSILGWALLMATLGAALWSLWQRWRKSARTLTSVSP